MGVIIRRTEPHDRAAHQPIFAALRQQTMLDFAVKIAEHPHDID